MLSVPAFFSHGVGIKRGSGPRQPHHALTVSVAASGSFPAAGQALVSFSCERAPSVTALMAGRLRTLLSAR